MVDLDREGSRKRVLFITPVLPLSDKGVRKRALMHLKALVSCYEVHVIVLTRRSYVDLDSIINSDEVISQCASLSYYVSHGPSYYRYRRSNTFSNRFLRLLAKLMSPPFNAMGFSSGELEDIRELFVGSYDAIFCFRLSTALAVSSLKKAEYIDLSIPVTFDMDDIESLVKFRDAKALEEKEGKYNTLLKYVESLKLYFVERGIGEYVDSILVCSDVDKKRLGQRFPNIVIETLPNSIPMMDVGDQESVGKVPVLLFVGSMDHGPNVDAVHYLVKNIVPLLRKKLGCFKLVIVGRYENREIASYDSIDDVEVCFDVPSLEPYYKMADMVVAPIRYGGGTRLKIIEAFAAARPVVSTTIGAEGLHVVSREHILLADTEEDFANSCAQMLNDKSLRLKVKSNAYRLYRENYSEESHRKRVAKIVDNLAG